MKIYVWSLKMIIAFGLASIFVHDLQFSASGMGRILQQASTTAGMSWLLWIYLNERGVPSSSSSTT